MNASLWLPLGSLASIAMLVALSYALGFKGRRTLSDESEVVALSQPYGGAREFVMDANGASAIAMLHDGRLLLCKVFGNTIVTRVFSGDEIVLVKDFGPDRGDVRRVSFQSKDLGFPTLALEMPHDVLPQWLEDLTRK